MLFLVIICDEPAAPDGVPRGGFSERIHLKRTCPAVPRRGPEAGSPHKIAQFNDFQVRVELPLMCVSPAVIPLFSVLRLSNHHSVRDEALEVIPGVMTIYQSCL